MDARILCLTKPFYTSIDTLDDDRFYRINDFEAVDSVYHVYRGNVCTSEQIATANQFCLGELRSKSEILSGYLKKVPQIIRECDINLIICFGPRLLPISVTLGKMTNRPILYQCGVSWRNSFSSFLDKMLWLPIYKLCLYKTNSIITLANHLAEELTELGSYSTTTIYPLGGFEEFTNNTQPFDYTNDRNILYVGRLSPEKAPDKLIDRYKELTLENVGLHFVGDDLDGESRSQFAKSIFKTAEKNENIYYHGWVNYNNLSSYYEGADVVALPSLTEGFPSVLGEAFATGTPVVCNDIPAFREIITESLGRIAPVTSEEFTGHLSDLLNNDELQKELGRSAEEYIQSQCNKSNRKYNTTIRELIKK